MTTNIYAKSQLPQKRLIQGQSALATEMKIRGLSSAFAINMEIFASKFNHTSYATYMHFDLNCGDGYNELADCIGSPLAFLSMAQQKSINRLFAGFCDIEGKSLKILMQRNEIKHRIGKDIECFHGNNESFIEYIPSLISLQKEKPKFAIGTILSDPNGAGIPIEGLEWLSRECPRLDIVINFNSSIIKRLNSSPIHNNRPSAIETIDRMHKKHWLISQPSPTSQQFTLLIGRNTLTGDHKSIGIYNLESTQGQNILMDINYTAKQQKQLFSGQMSLFDDL